MDAVRLALIGAALLVLGGVAIAFGILPTDAVLAIAERVWPVLLFVVAITVVAELAATAGVFDLAAGMLARFARGRTAVLWLLVVALAVVATAFLSLDTTAVLLTPVVVAVARAHRLPPLPFAFATVWLANTASLALPVSNLTNLLALHRLASSSPWDFLALLGPSALIAVVVTVVLLWLVHRRDLRGRFAPAPLPEVADRALLITSGVVVAVLLPLLVSGMAPWLPAVAAAMVLVALFLWRHPRALRLGLVPWRVLVFAAGLFLAVGALEATGALNVLGTWIGAGPVGLWVAAGLGMLGANAGNNLPAYLALEPSASTPALLAALLIGVNAGPVITPWGSLATLLWHDRLRSDGVDVSWRGFVGWGLVLGPVAVGLAVVPVVWRLP
ncbi:MAG: ArsB/NhaD family transporter [Microbacterium sp.]|uniref:SLC13 family permease n=1 Tax=Microbacterium sp. TaxID=51671 RepID=UPI0039E2E200